MSYDTWKLATPREYELPGLEDEIQDYMDDKIEEIETQAEEDLERDYSTDPHGPLTGEEREEIILDAMFEILLLCESEADGSLWQTVADSLTPDEDDCWPYDTQEERDMDLD